MYRTASNNATLVSQIPNIITDENLMIAPGQGKTQISILSDEFCEENAFFSFLPRDKFSYNAPRNTLITPSRYHNQMLLKFDKYFASDADYIHADFLPGLWRAEPLAIKNKVCYEQKNPGALTAGPVKKYFKWTVESLLVKMNLPFWAPSREHQHTPNGFYMTN